MSLLQGVRLRSAQNNLSQFADGEEPGDAFGGTGGRVPSGWHVPSRLHLTTDSSKRLRFFSSNQMRVSIMTKITRTTNVMATVVFCAIFLQHCTCEDPSPKDETTLLRGQSSPRTGVQTCTWKSENAKLQHLPMNHLMNQREFTLGHEMLSANQKHVSKSPFSPSGTFLHILFAETGIMLQETRTCLLRRCPRGFSGR